MDNTIKESIGDYRNSTSENNIQTPDMSEDDLISELSLSFDNESDKIDNINEDFYSNGNRPEHNVATYNYVERKSIDKFLGLYLEIQMDDK